jgi:hypothetical protein
MKNRPGFLCVPVAGLADASSDENKTATGLEYSVAVRIIAYNLSVSRRTPRRHNESTTDIGGFSYKNHRVDEIVHSGALLSKDLSCG